MTAGEGRLGTALRLRAGAGFARSRESGPPIVEASLAAAAAWLIAHYLVGHPSPFFAPVAAWTCLGFTRDIQVRAVAELAIGVSIGIGLGDLVVHWIGSGAWQIALILTLSALIARFVSPARLLAAQAGVQAIIVVALPMGGGPAGRWIDALIGGAVALAFAALLPRDARRRPRAVARRGFSELSAILIGLSGALAGEDRERALAVLGRARASQGLIDDWATASASARDLARISPLARRRAAELTALARAETFGDRALRSARVVCRRAAAMLEGPRPQPVRWDGLAAAVTALAEGASILAGAYGSGASPAKAEPLLRAAAAMLTSDLGQGGWDASAFVLLLRSEAIDLLRAAGLSHQDAKGALPPLA